jgi:tetratricopeptide (TPR) repeat protein
MMVFAKSRQERGRRRAILSLSVVALIVAWSLPSLAFDLGGDDDRPSKKCPSGKAWSDKARKCVAQRSGWLSDEDRARAGRQLARDGHFNEAIAILESVANKNDAFVLTYLGYSHRKLGDIDLGISFYKKALDIDPDNVATREYLGEGYVSKGQLDLAYLELAEIEQRCGTRCEEYQALEKAMLSGRSQY